MTGIAAAELAQLFKRLQAIRWLRLTRDRAGAERAEIYHDRLREIVSATIDDPTKREHNRRLAAALAASPTRNNEALARYYGASGDHKAAAEHLLGAAEGAAHALSFDHAATLYAQALELGDYPERPA